MKTTMTFFSKVAFAIILFVGVQMQTYGQAVSLTKINDATTNAADFRFFHPIPNSGGKILTYANNVPVVSDGTTSGTAATNLAAIVTGNPLISGDTLNNTYIFIHPNVDGSFSLAKTDGTTAGTQAIATFQELTGNATAKINPSNTVGFYEFNGRTVQTHRFIKVLSLGSYAYLQIYNTGAENPWELWKTDGTRAGTVKVKSINGSMADNFLCKVGNTILFGVYNTGVNAYTYWRSDGTESGTYSLNVIGPATLAQGNGYVLFNNAFYFLGSSTSNPTVKALWKTDGTVAGTVLVKNTAPGQAIGEYSINFVPDNENNILYFAPRYGAGLWKTDGTEAGTVQVKDLNNGNQMGQFKTGIPYNGKFYFIAPSSSDDLGLITYQNQLWVTDGTEAGTEMFTDPDATNGTVNAFLYKLNGKLLFTFTYKNETYASLYATDGTQAGINKLIDLSYKKGTIQNATANVLSYSVVGNNLFFQKNGGLWQTDGTAAGTYNIAHPDPQGYDWKTVNASGNKLYISSTDGAGAGLYVADVTLPKQDQSIENFTDISKTTADPDFELTATTTSGLAVTYTITEGNGTVAGLLSDGKTVTIKGVGDAKIKASQAGNDEWEAAEDVEITLTVTQAAGLWDTKKNTEFNLQGNPVTTEARFSFESAGNGASIVIVDLASKTVAIENIAAGATEAVIPVENLTKGIYIARYTDNSGKTASLKLIK